MRVVQVKSDTFEEYFDEIILGLFCLMDEPMSKYLDVETVKPVLQAEEIVNTKLSYKDIDQISCFRRALELSKTLAEVPTLFTELKVYLGILNTGWANHGCDGSILNKDIEDLVKEWECPKDAKEGFPYMFEKFLNGGVVSRDHASCTYLCTLLFSTVIYGRLPIIQKGDTIEDLRGFVYGND